MISKKYVSLLIVILMLFLGLLGCAPEVSNSEVGLPKSLTLSSVEVGSSTYVSQSILFGELYKKDGVSVRLVPSSTALGRIAPARAMTVDLASTAGSHVPNLLLGLQEGATLEWGPQPLRLVAQCLPDVGSLVVIRDPEVIQKPEDLGGLKIGVVEGNPAMNSITEGYLALGSLSWEDVEQVKYPSLNAMLEGLMTGEIDACFSTQTHPKLYEMEVSASGLHHFPTPSPDDAPEAWERVKKVLPFIKPILAEEGPGVSTEEPVWVIGYSNPIWLAYPNADANITYSLAKWVFENYDVYKDLDPYLIGFSLERQDLKYIIPWHEGVIKYFKEKGVWTDEIEEHNQLMIEREEQLKELWETTIKDFADSGLSAEDFSDYWSGKVTALTATWW